jgi:hypothetical protein
MARDTLVTQLARKIAIALSLKASERSAQCRWTRDERVDCRMASSGKLRNHPNVEARPPRTRWLGRLDGSGNSPDECRAGGIHETGQALTRRSTPSAIAAE